MRKSSIRFSVLIMLVSLMFLWNCQKSPDGQSPDGNGAGKQTEKAGENDKNQRGGDEEIDVDKLDIPSHVKEAIKSGKIPKEKVREILARHQAGIGAPTVKVEGVKRQKIHSFLILNGVVEPERKVEVYSRLSAYVKEIVREEGTNVKEGDILAILDDTEIRILHRQAEIQLKQAELTLQDEEVNFKRSEKLKETQMISEQEYQLAQASYNKARLDLLTKKENFSDLELQLGYTTVRSPIAGYVTERLIEVGTRVNSNQKVYTVEDFSPLLVKVYVPTADIINLEPGMKTEIMTDILGNMIFEGKIKLVNPRIDVQSGTVKVTVEVFDKSGKLKPGMFVESRILVRDNPNALVIPRKSVLYDQNQPHVFVFKQMQVFRQDIKTGISEGEFIEVVEGLEETDRIVTMGVEGLKNKMNVKPVEMSPMGPGNRGKANGESRDQEKGGASHENR